jgi:hypothetical protein
MENVALYDGRVFTASQTAVKHNGGRRFGFNEAQQTAKLQNGEFWYRHLGGEYPLPPLRFEGPVRCIDSISIPTKP